MITKALNENGELVNAQDAETKKDYYCLCCGCRMHVKKSTLGKAFFFALGGGHQSPDCRSVGDGDVAARDLGLLSLSSFQNAMLATRDNNGGGGGGGGGGGKGTHKEFLPPCNLPQLMLSGALFLSPDTPVKGGVLSDLLLTYRSFHKFIAPHTSLGFRVLELAPDSAFDRTIRFVGWWKQKDRRYRAFFDIQVDESVDFDSLAKGCFAGMSFQEDRILYNQPKYRKALVAGVWEAIEQGACKKTCYYCKDARTPCVGMQRAILVNKKQIYCPITPNNRTKHHTHSL